MEKFKNKFLVRAIIEFVTLATLLSIIGYFIYDKIDQMLIDSVKESVAQQSQSIAYTLRERFQHKLDELQSRAELLQQNKMSAEELLDVATIGTKTGRIRGVLREDNSIIAGEPLPDELFQSTHKVFENKKQTIDYLTDKGLLFAIPFEYEDQTCIFYELFNDEAVKNFYKVMGFSGKGTLILAKTYENWILLSDGLYPELTGDDYPQYDPIRYANYDKESVNHLQNFDDTWSEVEHSTLVEGKTNTFFADNGIDAFFFFCTFISEENHLVLSGYVEWDDVVVGNDYIYPAMKITFIVMLLLLFVAVQYKMRTRQAKYLEHEKVLADSANQAKSDFLSSMSHEIRTPINAIIGMDEMILRESNEPLTLEYAQNLKHAATSLLEIINDILDFSKIEAGKMEIIPVEYALSSLLNDLVNMIQKRAKDKNLLFKVDADPQLPTILFGDEIRIKQIVTNILTNAVKYTEQGGVTLIVGYEDISDDQIILKFCVKDTGIGIKKEDIDKLFSAFERIEEKRNRNVEGTGLGMNITQRLLAMMDSKLEVDSVYGEGSIFSFRLQQKVLNRQPIGDFEETYRNSLAQHEEYHEKFTAPKAKILVVDDTVMNLTVVKGLLKQTQIQIFTAESGYECLHLVTKNKYDLIFLDHRMPGIDGIETLHRMHKLHHNLNKETPIISLTANAVSGARAEYIKAGFQDYLTKPINSSALETMLIKYLPSDKVEISKETADAQKAAEDKQLPEWLTNVDGLSTFDGIVHCGGVELYIDALTVFAQSVNNGVKEIADFFNAQDWKNYTTKVHALKSSARVIGAKELSERAKRLEDAGNSGYINEIKEGTPPLLELYMSYAAKLAPLNETDEVDESQKPLIDPDQLAEAFEAMKEVASSFDYDSLTFIMDSLNEYRLPKDQIELYNQIKAAVANLDWQKIKDLLNKAA